MISERERKLMQWSYEAGFTYGHHCGSEDIPSAGDGFDDWLNEVAAEGGITVEMVVDTDAGKHDALDEFIPGRVAGQNQMRQQDALEDDYYGKPTPIIKARKLTKQGEHK